MKETKFTEDCLPVPRLGDIILAPMFIHGELRGHCIESGTYYKIVEGTFRRLFPTITMSTLDFVRTKLDWTCWEW